ncbi:hypothetical protein QMS77_05325, partial [Cronobacter sakazakii]|nr:hypothetical protein [Cronobacter sakazakii]
ACELKKAGIPYALNAANEFYDGEEGAWRPAQAALLDAMMTPTCAVERAPGHEHVKSSVPASAHGAPAAASTPASAHPSPSSASRG